MTLIFDPLTLKSNRCHPLVMASLCTKFDGLNPKGSAFILLTRLSNNVTCVTLTFDT